MLLNHLEKGIPFNLVLYLKMFWRSIWEISLIRFIENQRNLDQRRLTKIWKFYICGNCLHENQPYFAELWSNLLIGPPASSQELVVPTGWPAERHLRASSAAGYNRLEFYLKFWAVLIVLKIFKNFFSRLEIARC